MNKSLWQKLPLTKFLVQDSSFTQILTFFVNFLFIFSFQRMTGKNLLYYTLRVLYIIFTNLMGIPAYITWYFLLFPLRKINPPLYWKIEAVLFKSLLGIVSGWIYSGGYKRKYHIFHRDENFLRILLNP